MGYEHRGGIQVAPSGFSPGQLVFEPMRDDDGRPRVAVRRFVRETVHRVYLETIPRVGPGGARGGGGAGRLKPARLFATPAEAIDSLRREADRELSEARRRAADAEADRDRVEEHAERAEAEALARARAERYHEGPTP
jgi:hypothetical protein